MSKPDHILILTAEYRYGVDDPVPMRVQVGDRDSTGLLDASKWIGECVAELIGCLTAGWEDFDAAECYAHAIGRADPAKPEIDEECPSYVDEDTALNEMIDAAKRYRLARHRREIKEKTAAKKSTST